MHAMKNPTWPKAFAFIGFAIMGLALAYYSTAIATAGVTARLIGTDRSGDWLSMGSAVLMVGIAAAAAFGFLALTNLRALMRRG
jgi:threonine/homoserine/homoserine lactone efflux protein